VKGQKGVDGKNITKVELNRKNFVARVRNFVKDLEKNEGENLRRILNLVDENRL
jgi:hypothetical protein